MITDPLLPHVAALTWADLQARADPPHRRRLILRAWLRLHPLARLRYARPDVFFGGFPHGPKRDLALALASTPSALPGRAPTLILAEQGRGLGKSQIARWTALCRVLEGDDVGVVFVGASAPDAQKHVFALTDRIPTLRPSESPSDPAVRRWLASPLGSLYPGLRVSGGVTACVLHLDGRRIPLWARGYAGSIRGLDLDGIRPSLVVLDDLVTLESAMSEKQTADLLSWINDDAGALGTEHIPAAVWWLGNAIAAGDALDLAKASGQWRVITGAVWTPHAPPASPEKAALLAELLALPPAVPGQDPIPVDLRERWAGRLPALLSGAVPTDPDQDPLRLLHLEAARGPRAFARAYMCVRLATGEALWPMAEAHLVTLDRGCIVEPEGRVPLSACSGAVWLDPRGSEVADANDYAAAAAVVRAPSGRRYVLAIEAERCAKAGQRALYWRCVDALLQAGCTRIQGAYEANGGAALALAADWPIDAAARRARGVQAPIPAGVNSGPAKYGPERLDRVTDHIADGRLRFLAALTQTPSWTRMARIPHGHDDDADAVERADNLLTTVESEAQRMARLRGGR